MFPSFPVAAKEEDPDEKVDTADTETDPAHRESNNGGRQDKEESSVESKEKDLSDLKNQKRNDDDMFAEVDVKMQKKTTTVLNMMSGKRSATMTSTVKNSTFV